MAKYLIDGETLTSIADAIREKTGVTGKIDGKDMAAEIRSISSGGPLTLGEDKIARFPGVVYEANYTLWKLENGSAENLSDTSGFAWGSEYDFSSYISQPGSYFVTCTEFGSSDSGMVALGHYVSNVLTLKPWMVKLGTHGIARISDEAASCGPYGLEWCLYKVGENEPCFSQTHSTYDFDFSTYITESGAGDYYVRVILYNDVYSVLAEHESDPVHFDGGEVNPWLFEDEYIGTMYNGERWDLPLPSAGVSYTLFFNGGKYKAVADKWSVRFASDRFELIGEHDLGYWCFQESYPITSGTVSVRIND